MDKLAGVYSTDPLRSAYFEANKAAIFDLISGRGPEDRKPKPAAGVHAVVNMSSLYVPAFVRLSLTGQEAYRNAYNRPRIGDSPPAVGTRRQLVDRALPVGPPDSIYFAALELNGSGMRFYGDVCLVLKQDRVPANTWVLDRNSFDLDRAPVAARIGRVKGAGAQDAERAAQALRWAGRWGTHLHEMVALKVLEAIGGGARGLTTGHVSDELLSDEDYMEVLLQRSFNIGDLEEARVASSEAALDAHTGDRLRRSPTPSIEALLWRHRRRRAESALRGAGLRLSVVTTSGRRKG